MKLVEDNTMLLGYGRNHLRSTRRHKPQEWNSELHRSEKLKTSQHQQIFDLLICLLFNGAFLNHVDMLGERIAQ
jgi:hypothetical protein